MRQMHQKEMFMFCLHTSKNRAFPLDTAYPEHLSVQSSTILPSSHSNEGKNVSKSPDFEEEISEMAIP
jgi:hypothetical protein